MKFAIEKTIDVTADQAWDLLGNRFADIGKWASAVEESYLDGPLENGSTRTCELKPTNIGSGTIQERITRFDRDGRQLSYEIISGMPGFVTYLENAWTISSTDDGRAVMRSELTIRLAWYMALMSPVIKGQFKKTILGFIDEIAQNAGDDRYDVEAVPAAG